MNSKDYFDIYINAQKATGMQFVIFGVLLFAAAALMHFNQLNAITQGMRNGFTIISILLIGSGIGFIINQEKLLNTKTELYQSTVIEFEKKEINRMQDVNKSVPKIIIGISILLILILLVSIFFVKSGLWQGVIFSVLIYLLGLLILESISYISVKEYLEALLNL